MTNECFDEPLKLCHRCGGAATHRIEITRDGMTGSTLRMSLCQACDVDLQRLLSVFLSNSTRLPWRGDAP